MLKEFRDFVMRGNVVDLAVAVVIGGAFGKIVESMVNDIIMPIVGAISGGQLLHASFQQSDRNDPGGREEAGCDPRLGQLPAGDRQLPHHRSRALPGRQGHGRAQASCLRFDADARRTTGTGDSAGRDPRPARQADLSGRLRRRPRSDGRVKHPVVSAPKLVDRLVELASLTLEIGDLRQDLLVTEADDQVGALLAGMGTGMLRA